LPRHWRKNVGRLVKITPLEGEPFVSRIKAVSADGVALEASEMKFSEVKRAQIEIEFNRKEQR